MVYDSKTMITMVVMESKQLLLKVNGSYGKSIDVMESQWLLWKSMVVVESHGLQ
jgi:hypothetical protein